MRQPPPRTYPPPYASIPTHIATQEPRCPHLPVLPHPPATRLTAKTTASPTPHRQRIWDTVANSPLKNLWSFQGISPKAVFKRTFTAFNDDNLVSRAAELGYYFLFALFPTLVCASAIVGLVARSAADVYLKLLQYLALVVPHDALALVLDTFNQTTAHSSAGKITFGLAAAIWSASVGFSAIQDTLNIVYKVKETRPYWKARGSAMLVTVLLAVIITLTLSCLLLGTVQLALCARPYRQPACRASQSASPRTSSSISSPAAMLILLFAVIYYYAPDIKNKVWRWLTPGATIGIAASGSWPRSPCGSTCTTSTATRLPTAR